MNRIRHLASALLTTALLLLPVAGSGAVVFGLVDTGEIYSSANGGASWAPLSTLPVNDAVGLAAGVSTSQLFLVTRSGTVYRSADAGSTWSAIGAIAASDVAAFTINPDQSVLVLTESGTLYSSLDGGITFAGLAGITASGFVSLAHGPLGRLYALTRTGEVYESLNGGAAWTAVGGVAVSNATSLRRRGAELFILTRTGEVHRSPDYGRAWIPVGAITASDMSAILDAGSTLMAVSEAGEVYASSDGAGWSAIGAIQQLRVVSLGIDTPLATGVAVEERAPRFAVLGPQPNPARLHEGSTFAFEIPRAERVRLELYDVRGRRVATQRASYAASAGWNQIRWTPAGVAPGTYFLRITSESGTRASVKWSLLR